MQEKKEMKVLLAASLKELVKTIPIERITIKEITDRAGVIRPTFYYHFQDKYELLEWLIQVEVFEPVKILFDNKMYHEAIILIFTNMCKEKEFFWSIRHMDGPITFQDLIYRCVNKAINDFVTNHIEEHSRHHEWLTRETICDYYSNAVTFIVVRWIHTGMNVPPEEMGAVYDYMSQHSLHDIATEFQEK